MASKLMAPGFMKQQIKSDRSMFMTSDDNAMMKQSSMPQQIQSDQRRFMMSDDNAMMKQIQATHAPDGREVLVDNKRILQLVEHIISLATAKDQSIESVLQVHMKEDIQDKDKPAGVELVDKLSNEISSKCFAGGDGHETTVSLLGMLSSFSWDAKLMLTLASFALNYGHFWLHAQIYSSNPLAKSMAKFRQLPAVMEHFSQLKPWFDAIDNLVEAMLDLTRCVVAFKELPSQLKDVPAALSTAMAFIPTAVYWTVRGIIACTNQITIFNSIGHEFILNMLVDTPEAGDLSTLAHKVNNIHDHLKQLLNVCYQIIEEKMKFEAYETLLNIFEMVHIDNMKVLKALIYAKDDHLQPLFDGSSKRRV